ncbi:MAG: MBL fold metallo-hydrolase [Deltaproteobacteria bacterium]|nr:MBL fold metallo-hydrolase [Deltaproteobacteria bacterium]
MPDELKITSVAVGHGECLLIRYLSEGAEPFTMLVDGGPTAARALRALSEENLDSIDLLVLSHVDGGHVEGLLRLPHSVEICSYWGPCLAAYVRYAWLLPARLATALSKARQLEDALQRRGVEVLNPTEGHTDRSPDGRVTLEVLSPPRRLLERLLIGDDGLELFTTYPTPFGWLLDPPGPQPRKRSPAEERTADWLARGPGLDPKSLPALPPSPSPAHDPAKLAESWAKEQRTDAESFGNPLLNDTSLVIWIEANLDRRRKRTLLLTGDQENWLYLAARHPRGLCSSLLKAPHHGGRVFLGPEEALDGIYQLVRPEVVLVSANGKRRLPKSAFRGAATRWASSLFCPCVRGREALETAAQGSSEAESCHKELRCSETQRDVTLTFTAEGAWADVPACCRTPCVGPQPVVQLRQHIVDPTGVTDRLSEGELARHLRWLQDELHGIHLERRAGGPASEDDEPVDGELLRTRALEAGRHHLAAQLEQVLDIGRIRRLLWVGSRGEGQRLPPCYSAPGSSEAKRVQAWLYELSAVLLPLAREGTPRGLTPAEILERCNRRGLARRVAVVSGFPAAVFDDFFWPALTTDFLELQHGYKAPSGARVLVVSPAASPAELAGHLRRTIPPAIWTTWCAAHQGWGTRKDLLDDWLVQRGWRERGQWEEIDLLRETVERRTGDLLVSFEKAEQLW